MSRRELDFQSEEAVADDVARLRVRHEKVGGTWTLEQTCWHLALPLKMCLRLPEKLDPTPQQKQMQAVLEELIENKTIPDNRPAPASTEPPKDAAAAAIDELILGLGELSRYDQPHVDFAMFGPVETAKFRRFVLVHASHHLSFFRPAD